MQLYSSRQEEHPMGHSKMKLKYIFIIIINYIKKILFFYTILPKHSLSKF
jgi:hypothetical protein